MIIQDPRTGRGADVDSSGNLKVNAVITPNYSHQSMDHSLLYTWMSNYSPGGAETVIYVKNLDPNKPMRHNRIMLSSAVNQLWTIIRVTGGTPAGTIVTPQNMNFASAQTPLCSALGNAAVTGSVVGTPIFRFYSLAYTPVQLLLEGSIIVPYNEAIAITCSLTGTIAVDIEGYFEEVEAA
jgi:hypothetical protein